MTLDETFDDIADDVALELAPEDKDRELLLDFCFRAARRALELAAARVVEAHPYSGLCQFNYDGGCRIQCVGKAPNDGPLSCPFVYDRRKGEPDCPLRGGGVLVRLGKKP